LQSGKQQQYVIDIGGRGRVEFVPSQYAKGAGRQVATRDRDRYDVEQRTLFFLLVTLEIDWMLIVCMHVYVVS